MDMVRESSLIMSDFRVVRGSQMTQKLDHFMVFTLESGLDVGQGINIGTRKFGKNLKSRTWNKGRIQNW